MTDSEIVAELRRFIELHPSLDSTCGDNSCELKKHTGQGTNGGCRCAGYLTKARMAIRFVGVFLRMAREE